MALPADAEQQEMEALYAPAVQQFTAVPLYLAGDQNEPPEQTGDAAAPALWVYLEEQPLVGEQSDMGGGRHRSYILAHHIFAEPVGAAVRQAVRTTADALAAAYTGQGGYGTGTFYLVPDATLRYFGMDGAWLRWDWELPVRRYT